MSSEFFGELFGTMFLVLLGDSVIANVLLARSKGFNAGWIVIATGWGFALMIGVFVAGLFGSQAAHLNPAVTIGFAVAGSFPWARVGAYIAAQFIGAFIGAVLVWLTYYRHWAVTENQDAKLGIFSTGPAIRDSFWNVVTEAVGAFVLVLGIFAVFSAGPTAQGIPVSGLGPFIVGALLWSIGLSLGGPTGFAINPARDLAPRIAHAILPIAGKGGSDWGYSWVPVVGPLIGGALAGLLFMVFGLS